MDSPKNPETIILRLIFSLSLQHNATMAEMWIGQGWNLHLRRNLNDWGMGNTVAFHDIMAQFSNLTREEDKVVWKIGSKGVFRVNSAYKDLNHSNSNDRMELWP